MAVIRVAKRARFTSVDRETIRDSRLSFRARGLLVWLLDKPDDFRVRSEQIADHASEGRDAVRTALRELEQLGYLERTKSRGEGGRWVHEVIVHERPVTAGHTADGLPGAGQPDAGEPDAGPTDDGQGVALRNTHDQEPPPTAPPEGRTDRRPPRTFPPDDYEPNETHAAIATELNLDLDSERRAWIDSCRSHGRRYADHDATFRNWLRNAPKYGPARPVLDLSEPSGPSLAAGDPGPREVGGYTCKLGLGCANGNRLDDDGHVAGRCPCTKRSAA